MDYDTSSSGSGGPSPGSRPSTSSSGGAGEFNLSDPVGSFVSTVKGVALNPVGFFRGMQKSGDFVGPLVFYTICAALGGIIAGVLLFLFSLVLGDFIGAFGQLIFQPFLYIIGGVIGLFIGAGVIHLLSLALINPNAGFEATYRVGAYLGALYLITWIIAIPLLGWVLAVPITIWYVVLGILGIREAHSTTTGRAAAVVLIPTGILFLLGLLVIGIVGAAIFFSAQQGF